MTTLSDSVIRKFTGVWDASEWEVDTDSGWQSLIDVKETVPYSTFTLTLSNGIGLDCADTHIVYDQAGREVFVKDLTTDDMVQTRWGPVAVESVIETDLIENMYDLGVDSADHRFYSNDILSHNTTTAVGYLLWYAMFVDNSTILIAAHKFTGASEIMQRLRYAYEMCPDFIRAGATSYNKQSIEFENGSRIVAQTTTETTGRGMSVSLLYCLDGDTMVTVRDKITLVEEDISLKDLYERMGYDVII